MAHDWFLKEWMALQGVRQVDLDKSLGWGARRASELVNNKQRYNRDLIEQASAFLGIAPFELLMHPDDAMNLRRLRSTAIEIASVSMAADGNREWLPKPPPLDLAGTDR